VFGGNGKYSEGMPDVTVNGFASFNSADRVYLASPTTDIAISDSVTYIHNQHTFKTGVTVIRNRKDQNGRSYYDGLVAFNPTANNSTTSYALADAALGQFKPIRRPVVIHWIFPLLAV